ncbi:MAG: AI-2E family transporter [Planctomycetota bacterium]
MISEKRTLNIPLTLIALVAVGFALMAMKVILMPFVVAFFLVSLVGPTMTFLRNRGTPTGFAILILIVITALTVFLLVQMFYTQVPELIKEYPAMQQTFADHMEKFRETLPDRLKEHVQLDMRKILPGREQVASWLGDLFNMLGTLFLILLYMVFLLLEREQIFFRVRRAYDQENAERVISIIVKIQKSTENYIVGKTLVSLITGVLFTALLWAFGVKYFYIWGMLSFLLNFIPNLGSCIATLIPILVALPWFGITKLIFLSVCLILVQLGAGSFFEPRMLGNRLRLSPLMVFSSFIVWGWLWGLPGMILAVPIMATIKVIFENVESLKPLAVLISNMSAASEQKGHE